MNRSVSDFLYHFTGYDKNRRAFKPDQEAFAILQCIVTAGYLRLSPNQVQVRLPPGGMVESLNETVSMACLTETPLEFISDHINKYGRFGLGFSIECGLRNGGLHVIYTDANHPNSLSHTIGELSGFFMGNGMLAHDRRAIRWLAQLTAITEKFELRDEREWRFLRAPKCMTVIEEWNFREMI